MNLRILSYSNSNSIQYFTAPSLRLDILGHDTYKNTLHIIPNITYNLVIFKSIEYFYQKLSLPLRSRIKEFVTCTAAPWKPLI